MDAVRRYIDFRRSAPHRDRALATVLALERPDVVAQLLDHFRLRRAALHVRSVEALHVLGIEDAGHRLDCFELVANEIDVVLRENVGVQRRFVRVIGKDVPSAEYEIVELREAEEVADARRFGGGAFAEADRAELRERADRFAEAATREQHARDHRRRNRAHSREQHSEFASRRNDRVRLSHVFSWTSKRQAIVLHLA